MSSGLAEKPKTALVLPGGGARGAFQVGVLKAIAELVPKGTPNPFDVISGTSAGAVNSVVLASKAQRFRVAVSRSWPMYGKPIPWAPAITAYLSEDLTRIER